MVVAGVAGEAGGIVDAAAGVALAATPMGDSSSTDVPW
jgi:hypothetical protein